MDEERQNQPEEQATPPQPESQPEQPPRTSGMAIASLVLGILGLFTCVTALPGLILGIIALVQTGKNRNLKGQGMALAGTIMSGIAVLVMPIMAAILFPVFARARAAAQQASCINNVKQLSSAMLMYSNDWDSSYPLAENWNDGLRDYLPKTAANTSASPRKGVWNCAKASSTQPTYALNRMLAGVAEKDVNFVAQTVGIFESMPGRNQVGGPEMFPSPPRHTRGNSVGFADGHVQSVDASQVGALNFDPRAESLPPAVPESKEPPKSG